MTAGSIVVLISEPNIRMTVAAGPVYGVVECVWFDKFQCIQREKFHIDLLHEIHGR